MGWVEIPWQVGIICDEIYVLPNNTVKKSIFVVKFSVRKSHYNGLPENFVTKAEYKKYSKPLSCSKNKNTYDMIPITSEIDAVEAKETPSDDAKL